MEFEASATWQVIIFPSRGALRLDGSVDVLGRRPRLTEQTPAPASVRKHTRGQGIPTGGLLRLVLVDPRGSVAEGHRKRSGVTPVEEYGSALTRLG